MEASENKFAQYERVKLPHEPWRLAGEKLILPAAVMHTLSRFGPWRLTEQDGDEDEGSGILLLSGPPGTGKSRAARFIADAAVRRTSGQGNALIVHTPALFSEELGRSARLVAELFQAIEFSAARYPTVVIWDDAEGIFCSREQVIKSRDPTDLLRVTTTLNAGFDRLVAVTNVVQIATGNFGEVLDPAIVDRIDAVLPFSLPTLAERREIIRRRLNGLAGEGVVAEMAAATDGWSGRRLSKLVMQAYLLGTVRTRRELTAADFLRAVGLTPGEGTVVTNSNGHRNGAHHAPTAEKEEDLCTSSLRSESPAAPTRRTFRSLFQRG
jgi:SpoVK/Ycf46/Vps4 family AAA+-type ATPase